MKTGSSFSEYMKGYTHSMRNIAAGETWFVRVFPAKLRLSDINIGDNKRDPSFVTSLPIQTCAFLKLDNIKEQHTKKN